jgi:uncharacterized protein YyaL (SSP411 family)
MELRIYIVGKLLITPILVAIIFSACKETSRNSTEFTNALINETSPYLLQHAHNPVDWQPWSQKALKSAETEDKLVIISIGYSSCHWCHVMEEETFEDETVAQLMNRSFISIKVDREERPDVDQVYMTAAQLLTGSGGWPLNIIALPNGKPIYAGTYHSREEWSAVLKDISNLYRETPQKAREYAEKVAQGIQAANLVQATVQPKPLSREMVSSGVEHWKNYWDQEWGGNQGAQKFMLPANLSFLMDYSILAGDQEARVFVKTTLDNMLKGGVYDQLGGGFYRYSTDPYWRVPHFEKMLYDNAQMIGLYSRAYSFFKDPEYKDAVIRITEFLDREMKHPGGAYFAAMDADSGGEEGAYYVWKKEDLQRVLGKDFTLFSTYFNIETATVWEGGQHILYRTATDSEFIKNNGLHAGELEAHKARWRELLLAERQQRIAPGIDDKIITSWNALLCEGFAEAFIALGDEGYLERAIAIAEFLSRHNELDKNVLHSYKEGSRKTEGFLEDYAFLISAYLKLYSARGNMTYLEKARELQDSAKRLFLDGESGLFRFKEDDELIARIIKTDDGVIPSPNAVMAQNLFRIGHLVYDKGAVKHAENMVGTVASHFQQSPDVYSKWAGLMLNMAYPFYEVAVVGADAGSKFHQLAGSYLPNTLVVASDRPSEMPLLKNRYVNGQTFIYVCQDHSCKLPVTTVEAAIGLISYH